MSNIRCWYGDPKYKLGDIISFKEKVYVVIGYNSCQDCYKWLYELAPYEEKKLEFAHEEDVKEYEEDD